MPINSGSRINLPKLSSEEIGSISATSESTNLGWLSILLNVIEIGGSLLFGPEVGTAIALANAGAQTGINYAETGEIDALGAGLNFGSVIIPGILSGIKNISQAAEFVEVGEKLIETGNEALLLGENIELANDLIKQGTLGRSIGEESGFFSNVDSTYEKRFNTGNNKLNKKTYETFKNNLKINSIKNNIGENIEKKILSSVAEATGLYKSEISSLRAIIKDGEITNLKLYRSILEKAAARTGNVLLEAAIAGTKSEKVIKLLTKTETTAMKLSRLSSKSMAFATKVGGYITSPSSLAADTISKTVAKLTSKVEEIGEEIAAKMAKWVKAGAKGFKAAQDEFERTGGVLVKSKWIMGFKVLQEDEIGASILIQFKNSHPNVITKLSSSKLLAWIESESKGNWYINNIARSRGGRVAVGELGIEGKLENLLGMLPIAQINEIVGFSSFTNGFVDQIRANSETMIWHSGNYIKGFEQGLIQGVIAEGIKAAVSLGTTNQYAKQVLEGGFGAVASGTNFGVAFSTSFAGGAQSMKDTIFEDTTKAGNTVKNLKVIQSSGSGIKNLV